MLNSGHILHEHFFYICAEYFHVGIRHGCTVYATQLNNHHCNKFCNNIVLISKWIYTYI
jgi:hypothetical protein